MALQHHRSTKLLINQFESMSIDFTRPWETPPARNSMAGSTRDSSPSPSRNGKDKDKDKEKSPIRQSIINLLSVFKRNASAGKKGSHSAGPDSEPEHEFEPGLSKLELGLVPDFERNAIETRCSVVCGSDKKALPSIPPSGQYLQVDIPRYNNDKDDKQLQGVALFDAPVPCISLADESPSVSQPKRRQTCGVLLYLSQNADNLGSFLGPTWLPCTAALDEDIRSIRLSWSDPSSDEDRVSTHIVSLARCADVRSLISSQLDEQDIKIPLVGCKDEIRIEDFKVFEILFEGSVREKFAAKTVRERARWVSAIWDVVLPSQEPRSFKDARTEFRNQGEQSMTPKSGRPLPVLPSAERSACSIDPCQIRSPEIFRPRSPATPSIYPPSRPVSRLSVSDSPSRCHSPSIMNLHQKSMVRQRLAHINDMDVQRSCSMSTASGRTVSNRGNSHCWDVGGQNVDLPHALTKRVDQKDKTADFDKVQIRHPTPTRAFPEESCAGGSFKTPQRHSHPSCEVGDNTVSNLGPLLRFWENHAQEHREQVTHLGDQLIGLQDEIQRLPKELSCIVNNADANNVHIQQLVTKVDRKLESNADILSTIDDKLTSVAGSCQQQANIGSTHGKSVVEALRGIDGIRSQLKSDFPAVFAKLAKIQEAQERCNEKAKNERAPLVERNKELPPPVTDISPVLSKLDAVIALQRKATTPIGKTGNTRFGDVAGKDIKDELAKVFALLEDNNKQRVLHTQQQADSVRYLTELNSWLETFVNHGTSQIESVAANVEQLCNVLGRPDQIGSSTDIAGRTSLSQDLRALASDARTRQQGSAELQNSINALLAAMKDTRLSELGNLAQVVERHRQEQAHLFSTIKKELSSEIKGERIRFVEAMKEATSINVQMHVENFRQSLTAEALKMSTEIGHLNREKQVIESQIQQLLAFRDKQRLSNGSAGQAGTRLYQPYLEEYPTLTSQGHMTFPRR